MDLSSLSLFNNSIKWKIPSNSDASSEKKKGWCEQRWKKSDGASSDEKVMVQAVMKKNTEDASTDEDNIGLKSNEKKMLMVRAAMKKVMVRVMMSDWYAKAFHLSVFFRFGLTSSYAN